ncbi:pleiotropic drug resistance protein 1-like isoform X2 [Herrania umbratica]|uniref:Pleiotropic drug resistance protein 1-like isoform X2 n=1 Tax=Herrania umbratica TaxID=108875 RepID=A0A6J0ZN27_9ROSI|nr:pleiotropic drug resistance protein 1-like isoform X2 [Herrania umbratica]
MESGEPYRASSLRIGSYKLWRSNSVEVFSKSFQEEDDEEALKWAAIEKLPTFARIRTGILAEEGGQLREVDIKNLGLLERRNLVERLVKVAGEDHEKFLLRLRERIDQVGINLPRIEVRFEHLNVEAEAYEGSRALPTLFNYCVNMFEGFLNHLHILPSKKKTLPILKDVSGIIKPQRMALLLGPPSSGKTTLLLALAGKLRKELKISGRVTYNGHEMEEFIPQRTSAYISQYDVHIGEMTVRETLAFSARCQGVGPRYDILVELARREKAANIKPDPDIDIYMKAAALEGQETSVVTDYILKILGLEVCADTMVGDEMIRGISGGQKKRVTTGEMLVGPAKALFMDEISTGLDSSTTFQIVNALRQSIHILNGTAVISLLQPAPETYDLFDDIILLSDGQIAYQGPRENVLEFFEYMGFRCPERKGVADFLQEVTSRKDQEQYWVHKNEPYSFVTAKQFAEEFQSFQIGQKLNEELATPFDKSQSHPAALATEKYGVSQKQLLKACISRDYLLMKRNLFVYAFKIIQLIFTAFITMTLFLKVDMHRNSVIDGGIFMGALFFTLIVIMLNGVSEISMTIIKLPVFYKQREFLFYPSWAYALTTWIMKIPITLIEVTIWIVMTYYVVGFDPNVGRLLRQYLLLLCLNQMASGLFRLLAAVGRNMIVANTCGSLALLAIIAMGGFILSRAFGKPQAVISKETLPEVDSRRQSVELSLRGKKSSDRGKESPRSPSSRPSYARMGSFDEASQRSRRGTVLPFEPFSITFDEIRYAVDMPQEMKEQGIPEDRLELLKGVSGAFRPGVLTALMGVSGAGKTTLMDVLAGRKTVGYLDGSITISGYPKKQETFARISGYCEQTDIHSPYVTVYESLLFSAWLRLPLKVNSEARKMFTEEVMELVELTPLREALVGLPGVSGLSTEQRKRLTIAVELVSNPSIIFMDEPTSGLDARAAAIVMRAVRNTVDTGRTVVCTIHQPSIDIFDAFDELFLMKRGGEEIYVGPLGRHSCHLIKYFEEIEGIPKIKDGYNPATWMLEITSAIQEEIIGINFTNIYKNSELYRRNKALIKELSTPAPGSKDLHFQTRYSQPFQIQCMACLWKQHWSYWRNPPYTAVRLIFTTVIALLLGTIFWDLGSKRTRQQDILNAVGSMYAAVIFLGLQNAVSVQPVVAVERTVFYREKAAGMYSALPYAFGQVVIELPYTLIQTLIYGVIVYAMIGFEWTASKFFWYLFFMYFTLLYYTFYGMMTVAVTANQHNAAIISTFFYRIWNLFSGFIIPRTRIPVWWRWFYWICPVSWTLYGLAASQFGGVKDKFESGETVGHFVRTYFGFRSDFLGVVAVVIVGIPVLFAFTFAFSIKAFSYQRR